MSYGFITRVDDLIECLKHRAIVLAFIPMQGMDSFLSFELPGYTNDRAFRDDILVTECYLSANAPRGHAIWRNFCIPEKASYHTENLIQ